jgi:poly(3-hydroxyalkanoate) synthetase
MLRVFYFSFFDSHFLKVIFIMAKMQKSFSHSDLSEKSQDWIAQFRHHLKGSAQVKCFSSRNTSVGRYRTMRMRRFGRSRKSADIPTLIIPPLAVHDAGFVDLYAGNSLIETLLNAGHDAIHLADWRKLTPDSAEQSIDACMSDLAIAIDDLGGRVNLVGLSLGGLFALLLAARFPGKVEKLVLAGTPVDMDAQLSLLTYHAGKLQTLPRNLVAAEDWLAPMAINKTTELSGLDAMQRDPGSFSRKDLDALAAFGAWAQRKGDLSASYLRDLLMRIIKGNEMAKGEFKVLGRCIDLKNIRAALFVLAGARDEIAPRRQALRVLDLVGTPKARKRAVTVEAGHLALFMGRKTLSREWRMIAGWLQSQAPRAQKAA